MFRREALKLLPSEHRPDSKIDDLQRILRARITSQAELENHRLLTPRRLEMLLN
jgi:hypothetical protein